MTQQFDVVVAGAGLQVLPPRFAPQKKVAGSHSSMTTRVRVGRYGETLRAKPNATNRLVMLQTGSKDYVAPPSRHFSDGTSSMPPHPERCVPHTTRRRRSFISNRW